MRNNKLYAMAFAMLFLCFTATAKTVKPSSKTPVEYTAIPDANFEQALITLGIDSGSVDGQVLTSDIASVTTLNVLGKNISDLTGIQDFAALTTLNCKTNLLTTLDLSHNSNLTTLACSNNPLLTTLNVTQNTHLQLLYCFSCALTSLDLSQNTALVSFNCYNNQLTALDVSHNTNLNDLRCDSNLLTTLDVSHNTVLTTLECRLNHLVNINVKNGNNSIITLCSLADNPELTCIQADSATAPNSGWYKDATANYSTDCSFPSTPTGLTVTSGDAQNTLSWTANTESDLASYEVYGGTDATPTTLVSSVAAGTTTYTHTGLINGTTYYYRITAKDAAGNESVVSSDVTAVPMGVQTITLAATAAKTYGDIDFDPSATSTNNSISIIYTSSDDAVATIVNNKVHIVKAGTVTITANQAGDAAYNAASQEQTLTVDKAVLTVTADDKMKTYGADNPDFTFSYSGFVNEETAADLSAAATLTTEADETSGAGTYAIVASGAASDNYTMNYVNGALTVEKVALTITVEDKTKTYGAGNPEFTVSYEGFVNEDTAAGLSTAATLTTEADVTSGAGTYAIAASGAASANYTISYVDGTLTVEKATLTVTADNKTKTFGAANPELTVTYSGFVNGDDADSLSATATASTEADDSSEVGSYDITVGGAESNNYSFNYVSGTLTIQEAMGTNIFNAGNFNYYPNPVKEVFNVSFDREMTSLVVINMMGQTVVERSINSTQGNVDMSGLPSGAYLIKVTSANQAKTIKVIKE